MSKISLKNVLKIFLILGILVLFGGYNWWGWENYLSLDSLKSHYEDLLAYYRLQPLVFVGIFSFIYVFSTALSIPGASVLTLAAGALLGLGVGTAVVSLSSTLGATLAFLISRFVMRDFVQKRFKEKLRSINRGIEKEGAFYLFTLRLVPLFPFFLVNLLMGLTPMRLGVYSLVSFVGMLPGTLVYVNAGTELAELTSLEGVFSKDLLLAFVLLGLLPLGLKGGIQWFRLRRFLKKYKKPKSFDYNLMVIGGGSAGLVSAYIAATLKAKVALVEKAKMGGDCLNTGCVPSKALLHVAKRIYSAKNAEDLGIKTSELQVDFTKVMGHVRKSIQMIAPHDSVERYTSLGVDCLKGQAFIRSPYEVEVNGKTWTTRNIIIATGAKPLVPNLPGLSEAQPLTSENLWDLSELPKTLLILGGGPIGCELAQAFARIGSKVILVEKNERLLQKEDKEVSEFLLEKFKCEGIEVHLKHEALRVESSSQSIFCKSPHGEVAFFFDRILVALGRKANVQGMGIQELGLEISEKGELAADEYLRATNYPNIFLCGDVTGPFQFTHVASHQAWYASVNALFRPFKKFKADYRVIPWCTYTDPEIARIGINEEEAKSKSLDYEVSVYNLKSLDRAIVEKDNAGFVKVLTPRGSDKILGVTIVGARAGDVLAEFVLAMKYEIGLNKILGTIHIYPTFAEANKYVAGVWRKAHAPQKLLRLLGRYQELRRKIF